MINTEQERWALEFLRDISFDYNTLHRIDLSSLEQARDIVMGIVGKQHREITELKREIVQLKEEYNALEEVVHTAID